MKIVLGSDHRGADALRSLVPFLQSRGHEVVTLGDCTGTACDYPDRAWIVGKAVGSGEAERGILICGSGIGMSIAANKVEGVRAALVQDELSAELSRSHNNANVLCLSGDLLGRTLMHRVVEKWLATEFEGGRHARRVEKIALIERGVDPATG